MKIDLSNNVIIKSFLNLKWFEWILFAIMVIIGAYYMFTDTTHPTWYLIMNYLCSIIGITCIFLCAHASWVAWGLGIINTLLFSIILFYNNVFGTMTLELLYYLPAGIIGFFLWRKHSDNIDKEKCKTRKMSWTLRFVMIMFVICMTIVAHFILVKLKGATPLLDALIVSLGIVATFYEIKRYADQYFLWIIGDIIAIIQWILLADVIMITKKSIYLIMSVVGIINWLRMQKERNIENS